MTVILSALVWMIASAGTLPKNLVEVMDLQEKWETSEGNRFISEELTIRQNTIHFALDPLAYRGTYLQVNAIRPFSVWCKGKLLGVYDRSADFSLDSLARVFQPPLKFSIHSRQGTRFIKTSLVKVVPEAPVEELSLREEPYLLNFSILAIFLLAVTFVLLAHGNIKLLLDYFNFSKLLSIQERDEGMAAGRLGSSINLMVYLFVGCWLSFIVLVIFYFTREHWLSSRAFSFANLTDGFITWFKLSGIIVGALFLKVFLVTISAGLFKFKEAYTVQVLNFFRFLLFVLIIISIITTVYFVLDVNQPGYFSSQITLLAWLLISWVALIFLKLMGKAPFSTFHLFSYLCATEIFPLVIFFEILFS